MLPIDPRCSPACQCGPLRASPPGAHHWASSCGSMGAGRVAVEQSGQNTLSGQAGAACNARRIVCGPLARMPCCGNSVHVTHRGLLLLLGRVARACAPRSVSACVWPVDGAGCTPAILTPVVDRLRRRFVRGRAAGGSQTSAARELELMFAHRFPLAFPCSHSARCNRPAKSANFTSNMTSVFPSWAEKTMRLAIRLASETAAEQSTPRYREFVRVA